MMDTALEPIAQVVHAAIRAWARANDQNEIPVWQEAPAWMKESTFTSVRFVIDNPSAGPGAQHEQWMVSRKAQGWVYAAERDDDQKHHPMLVPFEQLPAIEQKKDHLVGAIVLALI
jgi:hypothetical protein